MQGPPLLLAIYCCAEEKEDGIKTQDCRLARSAWLFTMLSASMASTSTFLLFCGLSLRHEQPWVRRDWVRRFRLLHTLARSRLTFCFCSRPFSIPSLSIHNRIIITPSSSSSSSSASVLLLLLPLLTMMLALRLRLEERVASVGHYHHHSQQDRLFLRRRHLFRAFREDRPPHTLPPRRRRPSAHARAADLLPLLVRGGRLGRPERSGRETSTSIPSAKALWNTNAKLSGWNGSG